MSADSTRILKAHDLRGLGAKIAFNYEDLRRRCDEHVERVRRETCEMVAQAHEEAERLRRQAHDDARDEGRRQGLCDAEAVIARRAEELAERRTSERLRAVLPALEQAAAQLAQERDRWRTEWEAAAVGLSVAIAEKILRSELAARPNLSTAMIRHALELAAGQPEVRVRLHPADGELLGEAAEEVVRSLSACGRAVVTADPSLSPGSCLIETHHGTIDARIETQLERIAGELTQGR